MPWGTHLCQFYDNGDDLRDMLVPYFAAGLENSEGCLWVASPPFGVDDAAAALRAAVPDLDRRMKHRQVEIVDYRDWYLPGGRFDADHVLAGWIAKKEMALNCGYDGLRVTGNTFWLEGSESFSSFADYERRLNEGFMAHQMVCICSYCLSRTQATDILDVVRNHEFAVARRAGAWDIVEAASLKVAKEILWRANEDLEARIAERTAHLQRALADKEVLLREIHHRVKNNLQLITSLLLLKGKALLGAGGQPVIDDILRRIKAISLVHETLYLKNDSHRIDFSAYLADLAQALAASYGMAGRIDIRVTTDGGHLGLNEAIPVGLIATEVLTNSLKHAFPTGRTGRIDIAFTNEEGQNTLAIRDNGVGLPCEQPQRRRGAGLTLIERIVAQVGGQASYDRDDGTTFTLRFAAAA